MGEATREGIRHNVVIERKRLSARLEDILASRVTCVRAPAGYGKSTLLAEWRRALQEQGVPVASFLVEANCEVLDNLETVLIDLLPELGSRLRSLRPESGFVSTQEQSNSLIRALRTMTDQFVIIFDDVHRLMPQDYPVLTRFLNQLPANIHVVLATREVGDLPLGRMRAQGGLLELGIDELRFTVGEVEDLLCASGQTELANEADAVCAQTEGWAAGLRLLLLSQASGGQGAQLVATISGRNRTVCDFFSEDIFSSQPPEMQSFLLQTCILERFDAALCNAVTKRTDAVEMLEQIEAHGLFLFGLDSEGTWFRYHGLFAGFLMRRMEDLDPAGRLELHLRAAKAMHARGMTLDALSHAQQAGYPEYLAELLDEVSEQFIYEGRILYVCSLSQSLDTDIVVRYPRILLTVAWLETRRLDFDRAEQLLVLAARGIDALAARDAKPEAEIARLRTLLIHRRMMLAAAQDQFVEVDQLGGKLMREIDQKDAYLTSSVYTQLIRSGREQFRFTDFERNDARGRAIIAKSRYKFALVAQQVIVGQTWFAKGNYGTARQVLASSLGQAIDFAGENSSLAALPALSLAAALYELNETEEALDLTETYLPVARTFALSEDLAAGYFTQANIREMRGEHGAACTALDEACDAGFATGAERLNVLALVNKVRLWVNRGEIDRAIRAAELENIPEEMGTLSPRNGSTVVHAARAEIRVRLNMRTGALADALTLAQRWRRFLHQRGAVRDMVRWELLNVQINALAGDHKAAQRRLREALSEACDGGGLRTFVDEGALIYEVLADSLGTGPLTRNPIDLYAYAIMNAFALSAGRASAPELQALDPDMDADAGSDCHMTKREMQILEFVASGLRNREIGDRLGLTEGSVKWYMQQIYDKVGTRRRSVAVDRARQLGLLR